MPADGDVLAMGAADTEVYHNAGTADGAEFGISLSPTSLPATQSLWHTVAATMTANFYDMPVSPHGLFPVTAGTQTFYLLGHWISGGAPYVTNTQLTLAYFPTSYGVVTPTIAQGAAGSAPGRLAGAVQDASWDAAAERREGEEFARARMARELGELRTRLQALGASVRVPAAKSVRAAGAR